ncbi:Putative protein in type-1 retrotransposable element R1DM [Araneus ventricosus]|uniref:RNase H type-1 domain-containing protein n=1 Tax=Araneus ventricosus TaxID=182803 RepID=A0A4Y2MBT0_ARAVE|nr:Putative protein in type-1 retrotransposable element R1DM [Araneus ventricosus]
MATKDKKQGCPQGSCSGPALWNLVANEIFNQVWPDNIHIQAFADGFVLFIKADANKSLVEDTQSAITQFSSWCSENELAISTDKTNYILFSKMVRSPKITWNGYKINRVKSFKYLGIHVDDRLNWLEHINKQGEKAIKMQQNLKRIAGGNWGISQIHRWTLYKTVIERMLAHGSSAWCLNPTFKMKRKLSSIQRPFLLHISEAYRTTPTAIPNACPHPSEHLKPNQISFEDGEAYIARKDIINIFTYGSKTEHGVGAAFCVLTNGIWAYQWSAKHNDNNTVFQAELTALHEAVIYASHLPNHNTSEIQVENRASIMVSSNSESTNETGRKIFKILLSNPRIKVSWVKAHAGNIGNERADHLAKDATQHGQPYSHTKLPKPHIKGLLWKRMLEEWQTLWKNGDTGRKIYNIMLSVSLRQTNWIREDVIFFFEHGPFPAYLNRFHLSDSDYCKCGGIGTALHYATECIYTVSWNMRKPVPKFKQECLKRVANNLVYRQKIRGIIKFISENRDLFQPP